DVARAVGAVNTVVMGDGRLRGFNTDVAGAMEPLERITSLAGATCAVVGSGGSARAVAYGLARKRDRVTIYARNHEKARQVSDDLRGLGIEAADLGELASSSAAILINTTSVGMTGASHGQSAIPHEALAACKIAYDLVYNPLETRFLAEAR